MSACTLFGIKTTEQVEYSVLSKDSSFEIREYPSIILAQVIDESSQNDSFRALFKYISGDNISQEKISMTAPVVSKTVGTQEKISPEKIEMTAPVFMKNTSERRQMSFVLPSSYNIETTPKSKNENIKIVQLKGARRLVYTFSGVLDDSKIKDATEKIREYAKRNEIKIDEASFLSAGYNPPWTIPFLRRNEVLVNVES